MLHLPRRLSSRIPLTPQPCFLEAPRPSRTRNDAGYVPRSCACVSSCCCFPWVCGCDGDFFLLFHCPLSVSFVHSLLVGRSGTVPCAFAYASECEIMAAIVFRITSDVALLRCRLNLGGFGSVCPAPCRSLYLVAFAAVQRVNNDNSCERSSPRSWLTASTNDRKAGCRSTVASDVLA